MKEILRVLISYIRSGLLLSHRIKVLLAVILTVVIHSMNGSVQAAPVVVQNLDGDLSEVVLGAGVAALNDLSTAGHEYNALGFRESDRWLYAVQLDATSTTNIPNTNSGIVGIDPTTGAVSVVDLTPQYTDGTSVFSMSTRLAAGDFNGDRMYIVDDELDFPNRFIYSTDLTAAGVYQGSAAELVFDRVTITGGIGTNTELAVFDYDYWDGYLWGVSRLGNLSKLNLDGTRTDFDIGLPESFNQFGGYGGVWVDDTMPGSLFAYINKVDASNGAVYRIDGISSLSTSATDFSIGDSWSAPNINWNDGTYIIPEPATLCLLGLGSLGFLRRRKRT